ncbi:MAG: germination protein YpeB [Clostridia bacterium]|nr:germination protein YpeB [Clostridia bacterium]
MASFLIAAFLSLSIWGVREHTQKEKYNRLIMLTNQQSVTELATYMSELEDSLAKSLYCKTSPMLSNIAAKLWRESSCAKLSLSHLGDSDMHLPGTYKFLSQVGDYTLYLSEKAAKGETITEDEYQMLKTLKGYAEKYAQQASYMTDLIDSNSFSFGKSDIAYLDKNMETVQFSDAMVDSEKNVSDFPTLIYDGPFADSVETKKSLMLEHAQTISDEDGRKRAATLLHTDLGNIETIGEEHGNAASYLYTDGSKTVAVTKKGGYLRYMLGNEYAEEETMGIPEAITKGREFLESIGYLGMEDNYYAEADGIATVNYVYTQNGVTCYPDLIKVSVALDSGDITAFDATHYLMYHHARELTAVGNDLAKLTASVNPHLSIRDYKSAVIPTDGADEIFTVEFFCRSEDGTDVLVYVNPATGFEENILLLTYSDNGILTK